MGDTTTPFLTLVKPEVGASRSTWGTKWNGNADDLDAWALAAETQINTLQNQVATLQSQMSTAMAQGAPIGAIFPWMVEFNIPAGYLHCDGTYVSVATYPLLHNVIGDRFGGDGVNFGLPDLRGAVLAGLDEGTGRLGGQVTPDAAGKRGGGPFVTLTEAQMPSHQHGGITDHQGQHDHSYTSISLPGGAGFQIGSGAQVLFVGARTDSAGDHGHTIATDFHGGGQGHSNVQHTALAYWIIRGA